MTKTNRFEGLQEHWICFGKWRKHICDAQSIRGNRLRNAVCEVLGITECDENVFSKTIEKIIVNGTLEFHFYDGRIKTAEVQYFSTTEREFSVPLKKPFGYEYDGEKFVTIPQEAEAIKLMFKYYADGWKIADISRELESQGYHSCRGKLSRRIIGIALDSDFYIGGKNVKAQKPYELYSR